MAAPTGQYSRQRFINVGTNRCAFKPELALSSPLKQKWLVDAYGGLWLFGTNPSFYPGTASRTQTPVATLQTHISHSMSLKAWAASDATLYRGGQASVDNASTAVPQPNSRIGATLVFPLGTRHAIKVARSTGAFIRSGADVTTIYVGWQAWWLAQRPA